MTTVRPVSRIGSELPSREREQSSRQGDRRPGFDAVLRERIAAGLVNAPATTGEKGEN